MVVVEKAGRQNMFLTSTMTTSRSTPHKCLLLYQRWATSPQTLSLSLSLSAPPPFGPPPGEHTTRKGTQNTPKRSSVGVIHVLY